MSRKNIGFHDVKAISSDSLSELFVDFLANEKSILRGVFGTGLFSTFRSSLSLCAEHWTLHIHYLEMNRQFWRCSCTSHNQFLSKDSGTYSCCNDPFLSTLDPHGYGIYIISYPWDLQSTYQKSSLLQNKFTWVNNSIKVHNMHPKKWRAT